MKPGAVFGVALLLSLVGSEVDAVTIKKCSPDAARDLALAHRIIAGDITAYLEQWDGKVQSVNEKQRETVAKKLPKWKRRFSNKWRKTTLRCKDDSERCIKTMSHNAWFSPGFDILTLTKTRPNKIKLCYYKMAQDGFSTCDLIGALVHEMAHVVHVRSQEGHGKSPVSASVWGSDAVYLFGFSAQEYCESQAGSGTFADDSLTGAGAVNLDSGEDCFAHSQCSSRKCKGPRGNKVCT